MRKITLLGALALTVVSFSASAQDVATLNKDTGVFLHDLLNPYAATATPAKAVVHKRHRKAKQA